MEKPTRRRLLAAGFSGTALGLLGGRAVAAPPDSSTPTSDDAADPDTTEAGAEQEAEATTTTAPPKRPTGGDVALLQFALSFELAARDLYQAAIDADIDDATVAAMRGNHQAFASIVKGILGVQGDVSRADDVYDQFETDFATNDVATLATAAYELESIAVATHTELLRELIGIDGAALIASIVVVEARQAAVLADIAGLSDDFDALFENDAEALATGASSGG